MDIILILIIAALMLFIGVEHDPRNPHYSKSTENESEKVEKTPDAI